MEKFIEINENEENLQDSWKFPKLYKFSKKNKEKKLIWQVGFDHESNEIITIHGYEDGKIQEDRADVKTNKSGRNTISQASIIARKKFSDKKKNFYFIKPLFSEIIENNGTGIEVQLGNNYIPPGKFDNKKKKEITQKSCVIKNFPILGQAKLDGIRGIARKLENSIKIFSRYGKEFNYLDIIKEELNIFLKYLPEDTILDGELYIHEKSFNLKSSVIRSQKIKHPMNDEIKYYIFDIINKSFTSYERYNILINGYYNYLNDGNSNENFLIIKQILCNSHEDIKNLHDEYIKMKFEGLILRKIFPLEEALYKSGRNNNLLKFKEFLEEEGKIINVISGEGREKNLAIFIIESNDKKVFGCRPMGNFNQRKLWLEQKENIIGKKYTYRYFEKSEIGIPRFPTGICFRDYE